MRVGDAQKGRAQNFGVAGQVVCRRVREHCAEGPLVPKRHMRRRLQQRQMVRQCEREQTGGQRSVLRQCG